MRVQSALLIALTASLLCLGAHGAVTATADAPGESGPQDIRIELSANGDTTWSVEHHYVLEEDEIDRFEAFADEVRTGQREVANYHATFENFHAHAESGTDREMSVDDAGWDDPAIRTIDEVDAFDATEEYPENATVGTLTFSVTITNFADTDDGYLSVQDALLTADGEPWIGHLDSNQRLHLHAPPDHDFVTAPHGIDNATLTWDGGQELNADEFDVVLVDRSGVNDLSWLLVLGGGVLVLAIAGALWYGRTYRTDWNEPLPSWFSADESTTEPTDNRDGSDRPDRAPPAVVASDSGSTPEDVEPELLSDEERVTHMLEEHGGRMKQAAIVKETGWSNAKVSQLLSKMDDDDDIDKLRIGRENLITLPDVDPTDGE
ncbi:helix-turn-helix transcriptional regulator [Halovivax gelatinilyticus]|uniref:helix-turn-helix transcriptional regulator n=1 Tax=Halovivax gelatinilyticus TaxID=2961597 RepID=UPI0020CA2DD4|nr:hypothetical protein [Halovivax gelatinilyticus]